MLNKTRTHNRMSIQQQLELAESAARGEKQARLKINSIVQPLIDYQTGRFCKRFCNENQYLYRCTLKPPMGPMSADMAWCEWGNACYGWMLNDLTHDKRLLKYQGINGAGLFDYLYQIANSLPFYERWKDWRFGRKVHVPTYIQSMSPDAGRVFLALRSGDEIAMIAQKLSRPEHEIAELAQAIVRLLTEKRRLYLLDPPKMQSLTESADEEDSGLAGQHDLASHDEAIDDREDKQRLNKAWTRLDSVQQFVLEAMLIEEQDAEDVLSALMVMDISIKKGVPARQTNRQQLYYFRRITLAQLAEYMAD